MIGVMRLTPLLLLPVLLLTACDSGGDAGAPSVEIESGAGEAVKI